MFGTLILTVLLSQAPRGPLAPAVPSTAADPWTREMENRMGKLLEEQEREIMLHGEPPPITDRHEITMLLELEENFTKLQAALDQLGRAPSPTRAYKEIEKRAGSLITGIRWAVDGLKPEKSDVAGKATKDDLPLWVKSVTPKLDSLIRARKRRLINLEITQVVLNQLFLIQSLAKELARTAG